LRDALSATDEFPGNRVMKAGAHKLVWKASREWPGYTFANALSVDVRAHRLANPPDYMTVDMKTDATAGLCKGRRLFYASAADLPGGLVRPADPTDVTGLDADPYRTTKMVFRRIPAAGVKWRMGAAPGDTSAARIAHYVTLTNDYYMAIYMLTRAQARLIYSDVCTSSDARPLVNLAYSFVRGDPSTAAYCWPEKGHAGVDANSLAGLFRAFSNLEMDLATEAEWEFACRAGCGEQYYWGSDGNLVSQYEWTSETAAGDYRRVGLLKPNGFGLYDMTGNVSEWVLDQYAAFTADPVVSPVGPTGTPTARVFRPGSIWLTAGYSGAAYRNSATATCGYGYTASAQTYISCRFCCPAVIPVE